MPKSAGLSKEESSALTQSRILGKATALPIYLQDSELLRLIAVICRDLGIAGIPEGLPKIPNVPADSYYKLPISWFEQAVDSNDFLLLFQWISRNVPDFLTYFRCLCQLHMRRKKFSQILQTQAFATLDQISPRALLEYGFVPEPALPSWLQWRKWLFDIDNRSAQNTGYLMEPILAAALGGVSFSAKNSPVRRLADANKRRQVDCIVGKRAYEFKLRVTIAASGQGRFQEELEFASDAAGAGFSPVLLVLDPTPSARLEDLTAKFAEHGGMAIIGEAAWTHLEEEAGKTMSVFIERYLREPILETEDHDEEIYEMNLSVSSDRKSITMRMANPASEYAWTINRVEGQTDATDSDED